MVLPIEQRRPRIVVMRGDVGKRRQRGGIVCLVAEVGRHAGDEIALVDGVENLERAGEFERPVFGGRLRQRAQRHFVEAEPRPRELAVIGGRIARRLLVIACARPARVRALLRRGPANRTSAPA